MVKTPLVYLEATVFRFSGSKKRVLKHLPSPPQGISTIVEPFAGSLAYSLQHRPLHIVAAEANPLVRELWEYFRSPYCTVDRLTKLELLRPTDKVDARVVGAAHGLKPAEQTLLRLQISGAYVGQLSSTVLYPQHSLDLSTMKASLHYVKLALDRMADDYRAARIVTAAAGPKTMVFLDPPYQGTSANYKSEGKDHGNVDPAEVTAFAQSLSCPVLFTYGDGAEEMFPAFKWQKAMTRHVPILRGGGTRERGEWFTTLNWPT